MTNEVVEHRTKFNDTPKDGQWYELPDSQFIRWNIKLDMWDWMIVRDGKALDSGQLADGTELFRVE
jgi:hypothetical protein